ncbi:hypothetical protein CA54_41630 [Symmachiella macrocystis]|uniref:Uncharacterized protein n=1 Tax=Symmachiella macrocystis TaxID=2527985 RepID=A0A5C6BEN4_9PLAN|nr:hypothetical protein CA54_41630 [Symmachiella macrocystis]
MDRTLNRVHPRIMVSAVLAHESKQAEHADQSLLSGADLFVVT